MTGEKDSKQEKNLAFLLPLGILLVSIVFLIVSLTKYTFIKKSIPGDGFFPVVMSILVIIASGISLIKSFGKPIPRKMVVEETFPWLLILSVIIMGKLIGTFPAVLIALVLWFRVLEKMSWKKTLIISIVFTVLCYLIFSVWVGVRFDKGLIMKLIQG